MTLAALCALAIPGAALAQDDPPDTQPAAPTLLPVVPPAPTPVTDEAGAGVFAKAFLIAHAGDLVPGARAVQTDVAGCREVDAVQRFYCLATARLVTVQRIVIIRHLSRDRHKVRAAGDDPPDNNGRDGRDNRHNRRFVRIVLFRVRLFACVAVVRIQGGPAVTPTATLPVRDCVRVNRPPTAAPVA